MSGDLRTLFVPQAATLPYKGNMDSREKRRPTYPLRDIQAQMTSVAALNLTRSALDSIRAADLSESAALEVVHMLTWKNFRKSMPCNHDYRVWQDVYFIEYRGLTL